MIKKKFKIPRSSNYYLVFVKFIFILKKKRQRFRFSNCQLIRQELKIIVSSNILFPFPSKAKIFPFVEETEICLGREAINV